MTASGESHARDRKRGRGAPGRALTLGMKPKLTHPARLLIAAVHQLREQGATDAELEATFRTVVGAVDAVRAAAGNEAIAKVVPFRRKRPR